MENSRKRIKSLVKLYIPEVAKGLAWCRKRIELHWILKRCTVCIIKRLKAKGNFPLLY